MAKRVAEAALQYSKKLSATITWFWICYRTICALLSAIVPASASALATTIAGADAIMMINVGTYLVNSLGEKYIYSDRFVLGWIKNGGWHALASKIESAVADESEEENG